MKTDGQTWTDTDRQTDGRRDGQTGGGQTDRHTGMQGNNNTCIRTYRHTGIQTLYRHTYLHIFTCINHTLTWAFWMYKNQTSVCIYICIVSIYWNTFSFHLAQIYGHFALWPCFKWNIWTLSARSIAGQASRRFEILKRTSVLAGMMLISRIPRRPYAVWICPKFEDIESCWI